MEATPRRFIVLEEPMIFNYLNLKNELYTEDVKQFLTYDEDGDPTTWQTINGAITYMEKTSETDIILTYATYAQYLQEKEETNAKALKDVLLKKQLQSEAFKIFKKTKRII